MQSPSNKSTTRQQNTLKGTMFFYKGSAFPMITDISYDTAMKSAKDMIVLGLRFGVSMEQQSNDYKEQLDLIERVLYQYSGHYTKKNMKKIFKELGIDEDQTYAIWYLNICALLIMKKIPNNNNYGTLIMS